jgi:23S rRNA (cytidine1920-2'-O)/16S rRNA (cytidine1409-2'-O)-methyltransferase
MSVQKDRLDTVLHERGFFASREKAKAAVMAGIVRVDGAPAPKPGTPVARDAELSLIAPACPYVSRGGLKLAAALDAFRVDPEGAVAVDIGASAGGFTDCMLQRGARRVYAIDVGYGQLDWKLRNDARVTNMERVNIRLLSAGAVPEKADLVTIDVAFISLKLVLPVAVTLMAEDGAMICLIKPQFEAGRAQVGKNGIVRDESVRAEVIQNVIAYGGENGLCAQGLIESPIKGAKGNTEYLLLFKLACPI